MLCMNNKGPAGESHRAFVGFIVHVMHAHEVSQRVIPRRVTPEQLRQCQVDEQSCDQLPRDGNRTPLRTRGLCASIRRSCANVSTSASYDMRVGGLGGI